MAGFRAPMGTLVAGEMVGCYLVRMSFPVAVT
jgi:hypothetical protein